VKLKLVKGELVVYLVLNRSDVAVMVLHMNIMRHTIKKGFKVNYGRSEGKKKINIYDAAKESLESEFEANEQVEEHEIEVTEEQIDMLHSFINWYVPELQKEDDHEDNEILQALERIKESVNSLIEKAAL
jgi:ferritin